MNTEERKAYKKKYNKQYNKDNKEYFRMYRIINREKINKQAIESYHRRNAYKYIYIES